MGSDLPEKRKNSEGNKPKDYKKLSRIKSIIFLILAVIILGGMYLKEQPGKENEAESTAQAVLSAIPDEHSGTEQKMRAGEEESVPETIQETDSQSGGAELAVTEDGTYTDKEHVALYLHTYGKLPTNYITKTKAKKAGWDPETGNLQEVLPGMSIGGGEFRNEEGLLPDSEGRSWKECDIDYEGGERNGKRIVWSSDGLIYYTEDHYASFEQLYGN